MDRNISGRVFCLVLLAFSPLSDALAQMTRQTHVPGIINGILSASSSAPLKLYGASKQLNGLNYDAVSNQTFLMPSFHPGVASPRTDIPIYYGRSGVGPSVKVHYIPPAKIYDHYWEAGAGLAAKRRHRREVYLEFHHRVNSAAPNLGGASTVTPSATSPPYKVTLTARFVATNRVRRTGGAWDHPGSESPSGNYMNDSEAWRNDSGWSDVESFNLVSQEAKFVNINESLLSLTICKSVGTINLYDYFTDKTGVTFTVRNPAGQVLHTGNMVGLAALDAGNHTITAAKTYANGQFSETINVKLVDPPSEGLTASTTSLCRGESAEMTVAEAPDGVVYAYKWFRNGSVYRPNTGHELTAAEDGTYHASISVPGTTCATVTNAVTVAVHDAPEPSVNIQAGSRLLCDGQTAVLVPSTTGVGYKWYDQDNSEAGTNQVLSVTKAGTYKVKVSYANGCTNVSQPLTVSVRPNPKPVAGASGGTVFCRGGSVNLTASMPSGFIAQSYKWSSGGTGQAVTATESGFYAVTITTPEGCTNISEPVEVVVLPNPKPVITASGAMAFCEGNSVALTAPSSHAYLWNTGKTAQSTVVSTSGSFSVKTFTPEGCVNESDPVTVEVKPNVKPKIQVQGPAMACEGESVVLQVSNPQPNTTYTWSNGTTGLQNSVTVTQNSYVIANNSSGCSQNSDIVPITVTPIQKPVLSASGSTTFCAGGSVTLAVSNPGGADEIRWSNGEVGKSITVSASGNHYAVLAKGSCESMSDEITVAVIPNSVPIVQSMGGTNICEGQMTTLQVSNPQPNTAYTWNNGAGGLRTTVSTSGSYYVIASGSGQANCQRVSDQIDIAVSPIAKPTISLSNQEKICQGDSITLTINEIGHSYRWSNGAVAKSITVKNSGTYQAHLTNGRGCERSSDPIQIVVRPNSMVAVSKQGETTFCEGDSLVLTVLNTGAYLWNTGASTRSITIRKSGRYSVTVTNQSGCRATSETFAVNVRPLPKPTVAIIGSTTICETGSTTLTINEVGSGYRWNNGETTKSITVKNTGTYIAHLSNGQGCERISDPISILVNPNPKPAIRASGSTEFCQPDSVVLSVIPVVGYVYKWSTGETGTNAVVKSSGNYSVTSTSPESCQNISEQIGIKVHPLPKPTISTAGSTAFCQGDSVVLRVREEARSYAWSNGATSRSITVKETGEYVAFIKNAQGCQRSSDPIGTTMFPNPKATINFSTLTACDGDSVRLEASPGVFHRWSDGRTDRVVHVRNPGGHFVTVTNAHGCASRSESATVNMLPNGLPAILSSNGREFCAGESTVLTASEGKLYRWNTGETTRSITAEKPGSYRVTVINANDCARTSAAFDITVSKPTVLQPVSDVPLCANSPLFDLESHNSGNPKHGTYTGRGVASSMFNPQLVGVGDHKITYGFTNEKGCASSTAFSVSVAPLETIGHLPDTAVCANAAPVLLAVNELPVGTQVGGPGVSGGIFHPSGAGLGRHTVRYALTNANGCLSVSHQVIDVLPAPAVPTVLGNLSACRGTVVSLTADSQVLGNRPITYKWHRPGGPEPFAEGRRIRLTIERNEKIHVTASTACPSAVREVELASLTPDGSVSANKTAILQGDLVAFGFRQSPTAENAVGFEWDLGDGHRSQEKDPGHYYNRPGEHQVTLTITSQSGCANTVGYGPVFVHADPVEGEEPWESNDPVEDARPRTNGTVYPNPLDGETAHLRYENKGRAFRARLHCYGINGALLFSQAIDLHAGVNEASIADIHRLAAQTIYLFVLADEKGRKIETFKILKL